METLKQIKAALINSIENYSKMGITLELLSLEDDVLTVKITQSRLVNGYILNQKQLVERAKMATYNTGLKTKVVPVVFSLQVDSLDLDWINNKMSEFGIKRKDLIKQLGINKTSLSKIFTGRTELSIRTKASFYYYFLTYELNRDLRE